MKTIRVTSIVLAAAGSWYDWRVGAAAMLLLALTCEWLLHRVSELELLVELSEMRAIRDPLTSLFNRRWLEETGFRIGASTGVIVADVDHFKSYNDRWGHAGGDAALQQIARLMRRLFGNGEIVCRLGGEEFLIIIPHVSFETLRASAERLVEESRVLAVQLGGQPLGAITVSAGIALAPHHATTPEGLISAADRALYAAKSAGRDRVATPPPHDVAGRDAA
ncbi:MAG TPA: GGDEF domain-containing protein [Thermoanaerobaculia bacterium]|nr:GGDEF domain-containing protein [Thermoanaerobaculia bacterium]